MDKLKITSHQARRARTHSLVQLGALIETSGLLETFGIVLGTDLQKDPLMKYPTSSLFNGLLELNATAKSGDIHMRSYAEQGLEAFAKLKRNKFQC